MVRNPIDPPARIEPGVCLAEIFRDGWGSWKPWRCPCTSRHFTFSPFWNAYYTFIYINDIETISTNSTHDIVTIIGNEWWEIKVYSDENQNDEICGCIYKIHVEVFKVPSLSISLSRNSHQQLGPRYVQILQSNVRQRRRTLQKVMAKSIDAAHDSVLLTTVTWYDFFDGFAVVLWGDKDVCSVTWRIIPVRIIVKKSQIVLYGYLKDLMHRFFLQF